ncbi:MAG: glutamine--fructose-6-phosphate transaminase (isomerizing) [Lachnospiraceae bacterium]|nr:glutamine--fructose-6-phosphate transaminase (isomerizing) [Lachnospiraceae bacterium]
MCGIVGFTGSRQAAPILLQGLKRLEYRGYDSAGIAVFNETDRQTALVKSKGRLNRLMEKTDNGTSVPGCCGIGHTRWATHGEPSETNAHPHMSDDGNVVGVHNGIIENYQELRDKLTRHDYRFHSQTDTEIVIKLVDYYYKKYGLGPVDAINRTMVRVRGSYALALMFKDYPGEIWVARKDSPIILGVGNGENYVASDVPAILSYTHTVYYIENLEMARLTTDKITFYNLDGDEISKEPSEIEWDVESAEKGGFEHFMLKEIHEQPKAVRDTLMRYLVSGDEEKKQISLQEIGLTDEFLQGLDRIYIVACGSAYHVGVIGKYVLEDLTDIPVDVDLASEFRYRNPKFAKNSLVIVISQSGETADTLAALRLSKEKGIPVLGIVNVIGSSIARESDYCLYTYAGPEISVATTKAYSSQLIAIYLLAVRAAFVRGQIGESACSELIGSLCELPDKIERTLQDKERIQWFASKYASAKDVFFIGRGIDYGISLEGSLKLKEISYIHSEAYAAGELKHGTISLIEEGTLVVGLLTQPNLYEKTISNLVEVGSRGGYLMGVTPYGNYSIEDTADFTVYIPKTDPHFATSLAIVPLQLMAYYLSVARGLDVDKPRNLAKSVTVE